MPLAFAELNHTYEIQRVTGNDEVRNHLRNIGIVEGARIKIVQSIRGNMIVMIHGGRIALDSALVRRIIVK